MNPSDCELNKRVIWCVASAVFWIFVIVIMNVVLKRIGRPDIYLEPWLPRFKTPEELDKSFKDIHTLSGHFNSSYLSKQFPSSSSIYTFNDTHSVQNVKENIKDLRNLTNAYHKNITYATGLCLVNQHIFIASSHGVQTNLKDLLVDKSIRFTRSLIVSLIDDLTSGLFYLHYSPIKFHGDLNSMNCVITSDMELKISNFGINRLNSNSFSRDLHHTEYNFCKLWLAPEILRGNQLQGSPEADVYAFSILLHEIIHRKGPFNIHANSNQNVRTILSNVCNGSKEVLGGKSKVFRPSIEESTDIEVGCPQIVRLCLEEAWKDDPAERPPINEIYRRLWPLRIFCRKHPIGDGNDETAAMLQMLRDEKAKRQTLLNQLVPSDVVPCLTHDFAVKPTTFQSISVLFININISTSKTQCADNDGFNPLEEHVKIFARVCKVIDELIQSYEVYKVETVKETYVVASGMYSSSSKQESEIALFALHLCSLMQSDELKRSLDKKVYIKLGIHKGPAAAGVIGLEKPHFCLFGDTVNMTSRLCATSDFFRIQISSDFKEAIQPAGCFESSERGVIYIKGKGWHNTFWLIRSRHPFRTVKKFLAHYT